jgi:hypothetical protein
MMLAASTIVFPPADCHVDRAGHRLRRLTLFDCEAPGHAHDAPTAAEHRDVNSYRRQTGDVPKPPPISSAYGAVQSFGLLAASDAPQAAEDWPL